MQADPLAGFCQISEKFFPGKDWFQTEINRKVQFDIDLTPESQMQSPFLGTLSISEKCF